MRFFIFPIAFFIMASSIQAQVLINGSMVDLDTKEPIPFAHIYVKNTAYGTSSNSEGDFVLKVDSLPVYLEISHIGYENKELAIHKSSDFVEIGLKPKEYLMAGVIVQTPGAIIDKCLNAVKKNDIKEREAKAFYRQLTRNGEEYTEINEVFYDLSYRLSGIKKYHIIQGRYGKVAGGTDSLNYAFTNFSYLTLGLKLFTERLGDVIIPLNKDYKEFYKLSTETMLKSGSHSVAEIRFTPRRNSDRPIFEGSIFVDMDTYLPIKMKGKIYNTLGAGTKSEKIETKNFVYDFDMNFVLDDANLMLDYIKVNLQLDLFKQGQFIKHISINSILFAYEQGEGLVQKRLSRVNIKDVDIEKINDTQYNEAFWKDNPIIKRTPLEESAMESFEKNKLFGNFLMNKDEK